MELKATKIINAQSFPVVTILQGFIYTLVTLKVLACLWKVQILHVSQKKSLILTLFIISGKTISTHDIFGFILTVKLSIQVIPLWNNPEVYKAPPQITESDRRKLKFSCVEVIPVDYWIKCWTVTSQLASSKLHSASEFTPWERYEPPYASSCGV